MWQATVNLLSLEGKKRLEHLVMDILEKYSSVFLPCLKSMKSLKTWWDRGLKGEWPLFIPLGLVLGSGIRRLVGSSMSWKEKIVRRREKARMLPGPNRAPPILLPSQLIWWLKLANDEKILNCGSKRTKKPENHPIYSNYPQNSLARLESQLWDLEDLINTSQILKSKKDPNSS